MADVRTRGDWPPGRVEGWQDVTESHIELIAQMREGCDCKRCLRVVRRRVKERTTPIYYLREDRNGPLRLCMQILDGLEDG